MNILQSRTLLKTVEIWLMSMDATVIRNGGWKARIVVQGKLERSVECSQVVIGITAGHWQEQQTALEHQFKKGRVAGLET